MPDSERRPPSEVYDQIAVAYDEMIDELPYNADLEFPATTGLIPDVAGRRVLDAGCGSGQYAEWLRENDAEVVGLDASSGMLVQARSRTGSDIELVRARMDHPFPFQSGVFDGVVSGLAFHYLEDWDRLFGEVARVLRPGGFVVLSVHHPLDDWLVSEEDRYFGIHEQTMDLSFDSESIEIPFYRRSFSALLQPIIDTGFRLEVIEEPTPTPAFEAKKPESYEKRLNRPPFLCLRARLDR